jgi:hypothetical protein
MWQFMFKEIIPVYADNNTEPITQNSEFMIVKAAGTYSYHSPLNISSS